MVVNDEWMNEWIMDDGWMSGYEYNSKDRIRYNAIVVSRIAEAKHGLHTGPNSQ
jgi:hypothetical protein